MGRLEEYINFYNESILKYGPKTAVLYQCGNFYELYGVNNSDEKLCNVEEIANILNIQLTRSDKSIQENNRKNPLFAGFNMLSIDKFIKILMDSGYTAVVINQENDNNNKKTGLKRVINNVYSPGTYLENNNIIDNYIVSIFINKYEIGLATIDISIGKIFIYNIYKITDLDDSYRFIQTFKPKEIVIMIDPNYDNEINFKEYFDLSKETIYHYINYSRDFINIKFQNEFLRNFYKTDFMDPIEFLNIELYSNAITALCLLFNFCNEHNKNLLENIQDNPINIWNNKDSLILENNAINQLNLSNVFELLNKTKTKMGSRLLKERLYNPISNIDELNNRYNLIDKLKNDSNNLSILFKNLNNIDLMKIHRKINISNNKIKTIDLIELVDYYKQLIQIINYSIEKNYINNLNNDYYLKFKEYVDFFSKIFELNNNINPFSKSYAPEIYLLQEKIDNNKKILNEICSNISNYISSKKGINEYITIDYSQDLGYYFQLTPNRYEILKKCFKPFIYDLISIKLEDFLISKKTSSSIKLYGGPINNISNIIETDRNEIEQSIINKFNELILILRTYNKYYTYIADIIAELDCNYTIATLSNLYKYTRPIINNENPDISFLKVINLRHPLIEKQDKMTKYIPFSLELNQSGILLYGINSSGKSSTMKAIGLSIILAQAGFFVPAEKMEFNVYNNIMTRILNVDNIFKGLSSFAIEMIELRSILNRMNKNSLILGDEICHGTETNSAVSIVAASIILLSQNNASFIFATHLHKLAEIEEIKNITNIKQFHLTVKCDTETSNMIYDRKLKEGPGNSNYGIEVAKFLKLPPELIETAIKIRNKYFNTTKIKLKASKYNKSKILDDCKICGDQAVDIHHIYNQSETINDYVDGVYIHDKKNLISLCQMHHDMIHKPKDKELILFGYENDIIKYTIRNKKF